MARTIETGDEDMAVSQKGKTPGLERRRTLYLTIFATLFFIVIAGALSIPFLYESQTLWYKIGADKTMLRAGKMAGLLASVLLLVQILLAVRGKVLEDLLGVATLMTCHRINSIIILILACTHVALVLIPEGLGNLPLGVKFFPEMVGAALFFALFLMVFPAYFREQLRLVYVRWRAMHRFLGYTLLILLTTHVLFVSESFEQIVPRTLFCILVLGLICSVLWIKKS